MVKAESDFQPDNYAGRNIWFGVREFAMAAAMNGIALHGGTRVYGRYFLCLLKLLASSSTYGSTSKLASDLCYDTRFSSSW